jgi:hypothetical protein
MSRSGSANPRSRCDEVAQHAGTHAAVVTKWSGHAETRAAVVTKWRNTPGPTQPL